MAIPYLDNPLRAHESYTDRSHERPDIVEFVLSDAYLNRSHLYPRQATILKLITLQDDQFTQYDYDVIGEWSEGFREPTRDQIQEAIADEKTVRFDGLNGIQPDVLDRVRICKEEGRPWFREVTAVVGRRGSKGHLGAIMGGYVLWTYILMGDPQSRFGVDRDKRLTCFVFAGKKEQAKANQWKDLTDFIAGGPCFSPWVNRPLGESMSLWAPYDEVRRRERESRGVPPSLDMASFEILAKESTPLAGRGPAAFLEYFDEMAHMVDAGGAGRSAEAVYESSTPALDQFGEWAFIYAGSSPWQMIGQFYENWEQSLEIDPATRDPVYPERIMFQLTSWDPYKDWDKSETIPIRPSTGVLTFCFDPIAQPIQTYDDRMRRLERANPENFKVERRAHWAAVIDAYLNPAAIADMFGPYQGKTLEMQRHGILSRQYSAHGDPGKSAANFGWSIAHVTEADDNGMNHVIFDKIHAWQPGDYEDLQIDYLDVNEDIKVDLEAFMPNHVTFDQYNSILTINLLEKWVASKQFPKRISVYELTATYAQNWIIAETFKTALNLRLIHAPFHELASLELTFLQDKGNRRVDHPDAGPVQTKDVADTLMVNVWRLIGTQMLPFLEDQLASLDMAPMAPGGFPQGSGQDDEVHSALSRMGRVGRHTGHTPVPYSTGIRRPTSAPRGGRPRRG